MQNVPSVFPCYPNTTDDNYLRTQPGLYPDLLEQGVAPITFDSYPKDADYILNLRHRINQAIAKKV